MKSSGRWPANAINDIKDAVAILQDRGFVNNDFTLILGLKAERSLHYQIANTQHTYYTWLKERFRIHGIIIDESVPSNEGRVHATYANFPFVGFHHTLMFVEPESYTMITDIFTEEDVE